MRKIFGLAVLTPVLMAGACGPLGGAGQEGNLRVERLAVSRASVAVGETFEVTWKVRRADGPGDVFWYGLYVADDNAFEGLGQLYTSDRQIPKFFSRGDPLHQDPGRITCTRQDANRVTCAPFGSFSSASLAGALPLTLRACAAYVLGDGERCSSRETTIIFQ